MNVAIFLPNWLGDLVMATPTLRAVRRHFGAAARVIGIVRPHWADVLAGTDWLDECWLFHPRADKPQWRHWALIRRMRHRRIDVALLLPNSLRSAVLARLGGAKQRIGYNRSGRGSLLTQKIDSPRAGGKPADVPVVDYYLRLAEAIGCPPESPRLELTTLEEDERSADRVWKHLGLRAGRPVIAMNTGSANGAARFWPSGHFAALAYLVAERLDHDVLVTCGPKERGLARDIVRLANHPQVFSMADEPMDLGTAKACIGRTQLMVSTDSGPRHVAAALGKPVVTLYGPTPPAWSANPTVAAADLRLELPCIGCRQRTCPLGHHRCMKDLTPDMAFSAVARLLDERRAAAAA